VSLILAVGLPTGMTNRLLALILSAAFAAGCGGSSAGGGGGGSGSAGGGGSGNAGGGGAGNAGGGGSGHAGGGGSGTAGGGGSGSAGGGGSTSGSHAIKKVFIVLMENADWATWKGSASAPYVNTTLLKTAAHAEMYDNPTGVHPSLPNYLWLESGDKLGVTADGPPSQFHQSTTDHLVTQLETAGHTWKAYVENIDGTTCPLTDSGLFVARHVPMLFFDDVTNTNDAMAARCKAHVRPYSELATDLKNGTVADYNFITPNLCDDAHGSNVLALDFTCSPPPTPGAADLIKLGDTFLSTAVPAITGSPAFGSDSVLFVAWDEGEASTSDGPIGFFAVGSMVKPGYMNSIKYDHSSTLRTVEEIFGVPYLRAAQTSNDLSDFFTAFP
jgi:hypothetical protein